MYFAGIDAYIIWRQGEKPFSVLSVTDAVNTIFLPCGIRSLRNTTNAIHSLHSFLPRRSSFNEYSTCTICEMLAWSFVNAKNLSYIYLWGLFRKSRETTPWQDANQPKGAVRGSYCEVARGAV